MAIFTQQMSRTFTKEGEAIAITCHYHDKYEIKQQEQHCTKVTINK